MSDRYWIGSTGNWSDGTHWATSSGGSGGASVPTSSDDVFIDANSGFGAGGTITVDVEYAEMNNFTSSTSDTYTISISGTNSLFFCDGATLESGLTISGGFLFFYTSFADSVFTQNNATITSDFCMYTSTSTGKRLTLADDLVTTGSFEVYMGEFDANNYNVTANNFYFFAGVLEFVYAPVVIMGSGTWTTTGDDTTVWAFDEIGEVVTITPETSTIKIAGAGAVGASFYGGGKTYNNIWCTVTSFIAGSNTFNDLKIDAGLSVDFNDGTTQTVTTFTAIGTVGNVITLDNATAGDPFILSKSSGTVECDYLDISNSNATGGATWIANNSIDSGNNTGWQFPVNTTLTLIDAGTTTLLAPTITGDANSTLSPLALITTLSAMSVVGDANSTLDPVEAGSVTIPEITVGIYQRVFLEALALSTSLYEPTISVERNWGVVNRGHSGWAEQSRSTTTWNQTTSNSTPWQ